MWLVESYAGDRLAIFFLQPTGRIDGERADSGNERIQLERQMIWELVGTG